MVAVALPLLGAGKLLARLPERQAHAGQVDARRQPVLSQRGLVHSGKLRVGVAHHQELIPQGKVVVGRNVADDLPRGVRRQLFTAAPRRHRSTDIPETPGLALHIARLPGIEAATLDGIPGVVAKDADALVQHVQVVLVGLVPVQGAAAALPRLTVHQNIPPAGQLVQFSPEEVHGLHVIQAHQVKPEAVDVIFPCPVEHRINEIAPGHGPLGGKLVAAAAAVGKAAVRVLPEKVVRHGIVQGVLGAVGVVIHHVHHHPDARCMEGGDHLPALPDAHLAPGGVGGVAALRHVEVGGVVAPVILPQQGFCLVHAAKIKNGHQLDVFYPQPLEVVQAGGVDAVAVQGGALLGKGQKFAPPGRVHTAGRVLREIPDADLPNAAAGRWDHWPHIPLPALRVYPGRVKDHAAHPVHPCRAGVGVRCIAGAKRGGKGEIVVFSVLVAGQIDAPHALVLLLQGQGAHTGPAGAPAVQVHCCLFCRGSPQAQVCPGGGILHPQRAVVFRLAGKGFALKQRLPFSRCSWLHGNSSFHLTIV